MNISRLLCRARVCECRAQPLLNSTYTNVVLSISPIICLYYCRCSRSVTHSGHTHSDHRAVVIEKCLRCTIACDDKNRSHSDNYNLILEKYFLGFYSFVSSAFIFFFIFSALADIIYRPSPPPPSR